ncbi:unnamed protein product [Phytophthora lilii]|uniref:Unnamed protein product n=1 Tax=Phytophthora lilii TaxID=2077276 RepID=A0A9W6THL2_9STRA|nr:unnamed protein product [Phytophthora lilii]
MGHKSTAEYQGVAAQAANGQTIHGGTSIVEKYVAVTRVTTLRLLYLMPPLTKQYLEYFIPRENALRESRRLQGIEEAQSL